ncbi:SAM-dependent methyltransferase [Fodinibius sediminis]|uniref:16S rRNA (Cytidine1402-2'-O)-methyltransferase n=1 Tax=Fodinibius sediminis TaxID=1214077 RepID=A0A521CB40_9BACT|nr:SAM-dependent methyltransferase [Fodinibius sediminis]SMO56667.1 16S rRNA (cytidine1402-2'-O)-methyltransferase [Fodinibius sediminis]
MTHSTSDRGILYLVPNTLGKTPENNTIPDYVLRIIRRLDVLIVENIQTATRYLQWVGETIPDYEIDFLLLNKKTPTHEIASFLDPLKKGRDAGLLSEAGCPVIADPGAELIKMAHARHIRVSPLVGPSSILLALMGSGFNGQEFAFHGYLPIDRDKRRRAIRKLEKKTRNSSQTQIFMEAPHRNDEVVKDVLACCKNNTRFCTATNLTLPDEQITSAPISQWKQASLPAIHKKPTIFLLSS